MNLNSAFEFIKRWALWLVAAVVLTALVTWALLPRAFVVELATVSVGRFEQAIDENGQLRLKNRFVISAPVAAELARPWLKVGDAVRAGDLVAMLTPLAPSMIDERNRLVLHQRIGRDEAARAAAAAQLARLQTNLAQTELEANRAQQLAQQNFIAPAALDQSVLANRAAAQAMAAGQAQLRAAEFTLAESQATLAKSQPARPDSKSNNAKANVSTWSIPSPVAGWVVKMHLTSATPVAAGQALLEIGDLQAMEAVVDVLSSDASRMVQGNSVSVSSGGNLPLLSGRITRIEPVAFTKISALGIEEQRVNVIIELDPLHDSARRLGEGFRIDAHIPLFVQENALLVPSAALIREGTAWQVLVYENGRARAQNIQLKERNADVAWVESTEDTGLKQGDLVLLYPGTITDGQSVKRKDKTGSR
jgi:HlyD family secretion protein